MRIRRWPLVPMSQFRTSFLMGKRRRRTNAMRDERARAVNLTGARQSSPKVLCPPSLRPSVPPSAKPKANFENAKRAGVIQ